ncbi:hypothetical protein VR610_10035 [Aquirufa regiilacus]
MKKLIVLLLILLPCLAIAQDSTFVRVELKQGSPVEGVLKNQNDKSISLEIPGTGLLTIPWESVQAVVRLAKDEIPGQGGRWVNPHPNRYFFGPSAIPLKKRDKYYQNVYFLLNSIQIGLNDHLSVGGGVLVPFALFLTPKIGYKVAPKLHLGGGVLFASSLIRDFNFGVGALYGSATYGTNEHNVTLNLGLGAIRENTGMGTSDYRWNFSNKPMLTLSGMTRISNRVMLMTENWIFNVTTVNYDDGTQGFVSRVSNYEGIFSAGVRILGRKSAFDAGFLTPTGAQAAIPYLAYNLRF